MIRISTKARYGTRAMLDLALNQGKGPILLKDIAERQEISIGYLEQIIPSLRAAGLVNSTRGARGGYTLKIGPGKIKLKEILYALEGPISLVECNKKPDPCDRIEICITRELWNDLNKIIDDYLGTVTLEDLLKKHRNLQKSQSLMYSI